MLAHSFDFCLFVPSCRGSLGDNLFGMLLHRSDRRGSIEDFGDLFEQSTLGFRVDKVDTDDRNDEDTNVDKVVFPREGLEGDRVDVLVEEQSAIDEEIEN